MSARSIADHPSSGRSSIESHDSHCTNCTAGSRPVVPAGRVTIARSRVVANSQHAEFGIDAGQCRDSTIRDWGRPHHRGSTVGDG
jgi:hypothetical protein